jgi:hypothetical protein
LAHPELRCEHVEGQQFVSALMLGQRVYGAELEMRRWRTAAASQVRSVSSGTSSRRANSSCDIPAVRRSSRRGLATLPTMPWTPTTVKRSPEYQAGGRSIQLSYGRVIAISQRAKSFEKKNARDVARNRTTGHSVRWTFAAKTFDEQMRGIF